MPEAELEEEPVVELGAEVSEYPEINFGKYVSVDDEVITSGSRSLDDIIEDQTPEKTADEQSENEMEEEPDVPIPSRHQTLTAIDMIRRYLQSDKLDSSDSDLSNLISLENLILRNTKQLQQKTLDDFFIRL